MTTSRIDELVAGLTGVRDGQVAGPSTPGARALLTAITAEERVTATPPRRYRRLAAGAVAATAVAGTVVAVLSATGPGPVRSYANAAVDIRRTPGDTYRVHVKDVYADQRAFHEAFARFGLDVTLRIVPVAPGRERRVVAESDDGPNGTSRTIGTVLKCPPRQGTACPLTVEVSGAAVRQGSATIVIGRAARPGETYRFQRPGAGDNPSSLRLTGLTVTQALARLRHRHLAAVYVIGEFHKDGSGNKYAPPSGWRPQGDRRVTGAWPHSSGAVDLLVAPVKGDPAPDPTRPNPTG